MIEKIKIGFYYLIVWRLPHSRFSSVSNRIRMWYMGNVLKVVARDRNSKIENGVYISDGARVRIGRYCRINENVFLQGDVSIGSYVMIAPNAAIYSSTQIYHDREVPMVTCGFSDCDRVVVEDDVWIGRNVVILPGVRIGRGSIVGANAVVTHDVAPFSVVGGVPARLIRER